MHAARVSLNARAWDAHVSFTVLHLAPSPCGRLLAAATDARRHVVYAAGASRAVRELSAPVGDELTSPRVAWHPSGGVLFASSQQDATVHAWELADARGTVSYTHLTLPTILLV